jgi:anti-anti-sigma factor
LYEGRLLLDRGRYFVAEKENITFIRMVGNLKYTGSSGFDMFLDQFLAADYREVVIDLSEASFIDSTNLGMIARIAERARQMGKGPVTLISPRDDINRILKSVRFDRIFRILETTGDNSGLQEDEITLPLGDKPAQDDLAMILRAHQSLISLDEENRAEFQDVVELLEKQSRDQTT